MIESLLLLRHWDHLDDIAQQEQNADNIHYRMHFGGLSADDFDHSVRDTAESDTVSNAVAEGKKAGIATSMSAQSISFREPHIITPTMIRIGAVAPVGTKPKSGIATIARRKQIPVVKLVRPVLPPSAIPELDST